jgi:hypothetical protein
VPAPVSVLGPAEEKFFQLLHNQVKLARLQSFADEHACSRTIPEQ